MPTREKRISRLIAREIVHGVTVEQRREIEQWVEESEHNRRLYEYLTDYTHFYDYSRRRGRIDERRYWRQLERAVLPGRRRRRLIRSAAAVVLVALVGTAILMRGPGTAPHGELAAYGDSIVPGGLKARLVLPDGEQIELEQGRKIEAGGVEVNGDRIVVSGGTAEANAAHWTKLIIPRGGEYRLELADGTVVMVNSESCLEFPTRFDGAQRIVNLEGEAYFVVARDTVRPFVVVTPQMDVRATGTEFNVKAYRDEAYVRATLVEGRVSVASGEGKRQVTELRPSEQAELDTASGRVSVARVDVGMAVAWTQGRFIFRGERLEDIMTQLARWYDFDVRYADDRIRGLVFDGRLNRLESVYPILEIMESTDKIRIDVDGRTITIMER